MCMLAEITGHPSKPKPFECNFVRFGEGGLKVVGEMTNAFWDFIRQLYILNYPPVEKDPIDPKNPISDFETLIATADSLNLSQYIIYSDPRGHFIVLFGDQDREIADIMIHRPSGFNIAIYPQQN